MALFLLNLERDNNYKNIENMITMNMNSDEIFKELRKDFSFITRMINREVDKNRHKIIKVYQRTKSSVPFKETKIINASGNKYRIIIEAWPDKDGISTDANIYTIVENGITGKKNVIYFPSLDAHLGNIIIFEAHFIRRYRERYLKIDDISFEEVVDKLIRANPLLTAMISGEFQEKDKWNLEGKLNDRVALGICEKKSKIFRFITYISNEMLRKNQIHLTDESLMGQILQIYGNLKLKERLSCDEAIMKLCEESAEIFDGRN